MVADRLDHIHGMAGSAPSGMKTSEISSAAVRAQFDALLAPEPAGPAEYLLALALSLDENRAIYGAAVGPDAGAKPCTFFLAPDTLARARARALDPGTMLLAGQARELFTLLGDAGTVDAALAPASVLRAVLVLQS